MSFYSCRTLRVIALLPWVAAFGESGAALSPDDNVGQITLVDEQLPQVVWMLEKITGRMALRSQELPNLKINFTSARDLKRREAETALESLLALNGVMVVPEGDVFLKVVSAAKGPQTESPPLYLDSVIALTPSERVVARLFSLRHVPVAAVEPALQAIVNKARGGAVLALPSSNAVLVTDSLFNVQRAEALVARIDTDSEPVMIPLKHTRASEVVKQIRALQASSMKNTFPGELGLESNELTNQVMALTSPDNAAKLKRLVAKLDIENAPKTRAELIPLKHADAVQVVELIQNLSHAGSATTSNAASLAQARKTANDRTGANRPAPATAAFSGQKQPAESRRGDDDGDDGSFGAYFNLVADTRSNALVVYGTDRDLRQLHDIVSKVDVMLSQVRIEAVIVEVTLGTASASGLETFGIGYKKSTTGGPGGGPADINFNTATSNLPGTGKPPLALSGSLRDFSLETVFNKARDDSNIKILSSPVIVTSHNASATIKIGQKQPIVTSSASSLQDITTTRSTVEYQNIGLQLDVTPRIGSNGVVEMDVKQVIENIIGTTVIDSNEQPIIGNREANSYLTAHNDETIVLAGLQSVRERKTKGKVWLLGDIPWIGDWLFRPETNSSEKTELIIFLKPHVLTAADLVPAADTPGMRRDSLTGPDARERVRSGSFPQLAKPTTYFETERGDDAASGAPR